MIYNNLLLFFFLLYKLSLFVFLFCFNHSKLFLFRLDKIVSIEHDILHFVHLFKPHTYRQKHAQAHTKANTFIVIKNMLIL